MHPLNRLNALMSMKILDLFPNTHREGPIHTHNWYFDHHCHNKSDYVYRERERESSH